MHIILFIYLKNQAGLKNQARTRNGKKKYCRGESGRVKSGYPNADATA